MFLSCLVLFSQLFLLVAAEKLDRKIAWTPELYPKIQCHQGYDEFATDGGGERILRELATRICPEKPVGCYKRCIFEFMGILQETSVVEEGSEYYGKMYFEPEEWIAENLAFLLFTAGENDSGKKIASALYTQCSDTMQKLNGMSKPPTCQEQNELHLCMEQAMNCEGIQLELGTLVTKVCSFQDMPFHFSSEKADEWRLYNNTYPDTSCHPGYDPAAASKSISILSQFCSRSLNGCFKRCMFEQLGVLEFTSLQSIQFHRIGFRSQEDMTKSLQNYLFPTGESHLGSDLASRIKNDCDNQIQMFSDLTTQSTCVEENELYMCIEKAMGCPELPLQTGTLVTKVCSLEQVDYYRIPEGSKDIAD